MNKKACFILLLSLVFIAGCGNISARNDSTIRVGIVQLSENQSFKDMREGFMEELRSLGYEEDELEFICEDAGGSMATLNSILSSMEDKGVDLLVPLVTSATQAAVNQGGNIPIIFISVTDPVGAGIMSDRNAPDKNATGTCNEVPIEGLFELAEQLTPGIQSVGVLYDPGLPNSVLTVERAKVYFQEKGITCVERAITGSAQVQAATQALAQQTDAIYVPIDSTVLSAMPQVTEVAKQTGTPVYGSAPSMVNYGALATVSVSEWETGRQSAILADRYLKGEAIEDIPALIVDDFLTVINVKTAEDLGITISEDIADTAQLVGE